MPKKGIQVSTHIARSPIDVWNYMCDVSNEVLWRYGVYLAQWFSEPPYGAGSIGFHIVASMGDYPWQVAEWDELLTSVGMYSMADSKVLALVIVFCLKIPVAV